MKIGTMKTALTQGVDPVPGGWATRIDAPSLIHLRNQALGLPLNPINIRSKQSGAYLSPFKGRGMAFSESRPYQSGDEMRHMDWRVMARTGKPHTKLFHEERERSILIWVDLRSPMFFATHGMYKAVQAARGAALVAWGATLNGDRLGGVVFTQKDHQEVRPSHGNRGVLRLIGLMANTLDQTSLQAEEIPQNLEMNLVRLRRIARSGSQLFLFSDFMDLGEREKIHLAQLARHNDIVLIFFHDRLERTLPPPGSYPLMVGTQFFFLDTNSEKSRRIHQENFIKRQENLEIFCRQNRILFLSCSTEEDSVSLIKRTFGMRFR